MSFAYKLWKIGRILTENEIMDSVYDKAEMAEGEDPQFVNINFQVLNNEVKDILYSKNSISKEKIFFTKKIGGSGDGIYYLYPNLNIRKENLKKKIIQLVNTLKSSIRVYANEQNQKIAELIFLKFEEIKKYIERAEVELELIHLKKQYEELNESSIHKEDGTTAQKIDKKIAKNNEKCTKLIETRNFWDHLLLKLCRYLVDFPKGNYWLWFSINGKTFYELMPEVWSNWYENPVSIRDNLKIGYDAFTNKVTEVGYKPEVKVFSYDQYHKSMEYRLNENLPLSLESARNIKFAWMYILNNLVFYYKGLEYIIIPNLISDDAGLYKTVLNRFRRANKKSSEKKSKLEKFNAQEKGLEKDIDKLKKKEKLSKSNNENLNKLVQQSEETLSKIKELDTGMIREFDEQLNEVGDIKNSINVDYIFTSINKTNLSFEIKGSIEDVIPSQVRNVVTEMANYNIRDLVKFGKRDRNETLLQDFFNREELSFILNRSQKNNGNKILQERLYMARLLLTNTKIEIDQLLQRFETNRLLGYDKKKRLTKDGISEWIEFSKNFTTNENNIYNFLKRLGKIKG
ncbi:MAG: TM1802 family CRISPR-associated protein [Thermodesulfobacteriota bacterium]|nr:TM1802 family CRISPR-associated protein [Thermodesulfobacteriota bacterium]